jgi:putative multiple sugar transport system permease protein
MTAPVTTDRRGGLADIRKAFGGGQSTARQFGILAALILIIVFFQVTTGGLTLSPTNLINVVNQYSYILILAIGMVMVIIMGHIDLSVGSIAAFTGIVVAKSMTDWSLPWPLAIVLGLLVGAAIGAFQGFWVAYVGVPAFIVTLAGMLIWRGANQVVGQSTTIPVPEGFTEIGAGYLPEVSVPLPFNVLTMVLGVVGAAWIVWNEIRLRARQKRTGAESAPVWVSVIKVVVVAGALLAAAWLFANGRPGTSFPISGIILVVLVIVYSFITNNTTFGRRIYAVGGNRQAAALSGVKDRRVDFFVMMNMSVLAALAGMIFVARSGASGPQDGNGWELDAIAAVFIGGAAVSGGIGTVLGSIIGGLVMAFLNNGLQLMGVDADWVSIIKGAVLLLAVGIDVLSKMSGRPSIIGTWTQRRAARVEVPTMPPAVEPTAGTNETSQPADAGRR